MPSKAFAELMDVIREFRSSQARQPDRESARRAQIERAAAYRPPAGVGDEPVDALIGGSYLATPDDARDDIVVMFVHGGGFQGGDAATCRPLAAHLARGTRARVLLPEYRMAPEHPYPAALDDCEAAFRYAAALAPRVVVAGGSAGANLALGVLLRRTAAGDTRPLAGVLHAGVFDLRPQRFTAGSWVDREDTDVVMAGADDSMNTAYLAGHPAEDPLASPLLADLRGLPPVFIQASSAERLLDDSLHLAARAARAGVHVELEVWPHMSHGWQAAVGGVPEATEAVERTAAFVNRVAEGRIVDGAALCGVPPTDGLKSA